MNRIQRVVGRMAGLVVPELTMFNGIVGYRMPGGQFVPLPGIAGGAGSPTAITLLTARAPAASAATVVEFFPIPDQDEHNAFLCQGFFWLYETTEANADNTVDFTSTFGAAGTGTNIFVNANANGLLDTGAPSTVFTNRRDAASGGAAAAAAANPANVRVPAGNAIQITIVTAGTGTIPAVQVGIYGSYV